MNIGPATHGNKGGIEVGENTRFRCLFRGDGSREGGAGCSFFRGNGSFNHGVRWRRRPEPHARQAVSQ